MRKISRLLIPAFIAVALLSGCEDKMDEITIEEGAIETFGNAEAMPPKSKIKLPPGYNTSSSSSSTSGTSK